MTDNTQTPSTENAYDPINLEARHRELAEIWDSRFLQAPDYIKVEMQLRALAAKNWDAHLLKLQSLRSDEQATREEAAQVLKEIEEKRIAQRNDPRLITAVYVQLREWMIAVMAKFKLSPVGEYLPEDVEVTEVLAEKAEYAREVYPERREVLSRLITDVSDAFSSKDCTVEEVITVVRRYQKEVFPRHTMLCSEYAIVADLLDPIFELTARFGIDMVGDLLPEPDRSKKREAFEMLRDMREWLDIMGQKKTNDALMFDIFERLRKPNGGFASATELDPVSIRGEKDIVKFYDISGPYIKKLNKERKEKQAAQQHEAAFLPETETAVSPFTYGGPKDSRFKEWMEHATKFHPNKPWFVFELLDRWIDDGIATAQRLLNAKLDPILRDYIEPRRGRVGLLRRKQSFEDAAYAMLSDSLHEIYQIAEPYESIIDVLEQLKAILYYKRVPLKNQTGAALWHNWGVCTNALKALGYGADTETTLEQFMMFMANCRTMGLDQPLPAPVARQLVYL